MPCRSRSSRESQPSPAPAGPPPRRAGTAHREGPAHARPHRAGARAAREARSARVELLDLVRVLLVDGLALELHRGRQLVAARLPVDRQDLELLDLLDAG